MTSTRLDRHKLFIPRIESHSLEQVASSRIDLTSAGWDLHFGEERSCVNLGIDGFSISIESIPKKSSRAQGRLDLGAGVPLLPWCRGAHNNTLAKHILKEFEVCQCICMHKGMSRTEAKHLCVGQFHVDSSHRVWPSQWEIQLLVATLTVSNSGKDACTDDAIVGHMALVTSIKICPVHATFSTGTDQGRFGLVGGSCSSASLEAWRLDAWHDSTKHRHDKLIIWMVLKKQSWGIWVCPNMVDTPNGNFMGNTTMNPEIWDTIFSDKSTSIIAFLHFPGEVQSFDVDLDFSMMVASRILPQPEREQHDTILAWSTVAIYSSATCFAKSSPIRRSSPTSPRSLIASDCGGSDTGDLQAFELQNFWGLNESCPKETSGTFQGVRRRCCRQEKNRKNVAEHKGHFSFPSRGLTGIGSGFDLKRCWSNDAVVTESLRCQVLATGPDRLQQQRLLHGTQQPIQWLHGIFFIRDLMKLMRRTCAPV